MPKNITENRTVLRVAAQEIYKANEQCEYFPSYEIITGSYMKGKYFENDLRFVTQERVDHVMKLFLQHYINTEHDSTFVNELKRMNTLLSEMICDEEAIIRNN